MLDLILNATLSFMGTDRCTKKLKLNNLGTTSGKKPQAKPCVWSRSLHYLHSGWDTAAAAAADPSPTFHNLSSYCVYYTAS